MWRGHLGVGEQETRKDRGFCSGTERKSGARVWLGQLKGLFLQAQGLGLISLTVEPRDNWQNEDFLRHLRPIPKSVNETGIPRIERGATSRVVRELEKLRTQEDELGRQIGNWQRKLTRIEKLSGAATNFDEALGVQQSRLEGIGWFSSRIKDAALECPMCGAANETAAEEVTHLIALSNEVQNAAAAMTRARALMDREAVDARARISELEGEMQMIRDNVQAVEGRSDELNSQKQTLKQIHQFVGGLRAALQTLETASDDAGLGEEVSTLQAEERELRTALQTKNESGRMEAALQGLSTRISPQQFHEGLKEA